MTTACVNLKDRSSCENSDGFLAKYMQGALAGIREDVDS